MDGNWPFTTCEKISPSLEKCSEEPPKTQKLTTTTTTATTKEKERKEKYIESN